MLSDAVNVKHPLRATAPAKPEFRPLKGAAMADVAGEKNQRFGSTLAAVIDVMGKKFRASADVPSGRGSFDGDQFGQSTYSKSRHQKRMDDELADVVGACGKHIDGGAVHVLDRREVDDEL